MKPNTEGIKKCNIRINNKIRNDRKTQMKKEKNV
jgi:hypothetical protein